MALYRYVRDKDELLMLLLERAFVRLSRPRLSRVPRLRLIRLWRFLHAGLSENAWVAEVLIGGSFMAPSALWVMEAILEAFVACGLSAERAAEAYRIVWSFTIGDLLARAARAKATLAAPARASRQIELLAHADPQSTPLLAALRSYWAAARLRNTYETDIVRLLDALLANA